MQIACAVLFDKPLQVTISEFSIGSHISDLSIRFFEESPGIQVIIPIPIPAPSPIPGISPPPGFGAGTGGSGIGTGAGAGFGSIR